MTGKRVPQAWQDRRNVLPRRRAELAVLNLDRAGSGLRIVDTAQALPSMISPAAGRRRPTEPSDDHWAGIFEARNRRNNHEYQDDGRFLADTGRDSDQGRGFK